MFFPGYLGRREFLVHQIFGPHEPVWLTPVRTVWDGSISLGGVLIKKKEFAWAVDLCVLCLFFFLRNCAKISFYNLFFTFEDIIHKIGYFCRINFYNGRINIYLQ